MTIIGDAAHAGLPNGQGLNLAIEDGEALLLFKLEPCVAQMLLSKHQLGVNPVEASLRKGGVALDSIFLDR